MERNMSIVIPATSEQVLKHGVHIGRTEEIGFDSIDLWTGLVSNESQIAVYWYPEEDDTDGRLYFDLKIIGDHTIVLDAMKKLEPELEALITHSRMLRMFGHIDTEYDAREISTH
jgi:hypothetical protein